MFLKRATNSEFPSKCGNTTLNHESFAEKFGGFKTEPYICTRKTGLPYGVMVAQQILVLHD
jgi:hypothetical protein